jgi:hypothetical protein
MSWSIKSREWGTPRELLVGIAAAQLAGG